MSQPKQKRTVLRSLDDAIADAQKELSQLPKEEIPVEIPNDFHGKLAHYLGMAISGAQEQAKVIKIQNPDAHVCVHIKEIPKDLFDKLQLPKHSDFLTKLNQRGFEFYPTNVGNFDVQKYMVKFSLHF